ncbi:GHMP kinase [Candidatus Liberibacter africanus]|uniref:Mevalonate kinase n=1 Tax=Candidatus Liberibacter africanus PTSAPSY TaxID=1277257 RepID=A0A0G3I7I4_LIBAF|nr:GHMP kinase [Candidatus Liberibacter africanus]AKK19672.1 mevalonate kinase [Candidatus Liberibacter africanus PTSAPSY]QTP63562.1 GHMP kinase [Candidatus Liberibacter africanus]
MKKQPLQNSSATSISPAKVILSGEYSALYGGSALAMTISFYLRASLTTIEPSIIRIINPDPIEYSFKKCLSIGNQIDQRYHDFTKKKIPISSVLTNPNDLIIYIVNRHFHNISSGISLEIHSTIPIGAGFGSSSAIISAVSLALSAITNKPFCNKEKLISETSYIERLQHGKTGVVDPTTIIIGGIVYINPPHIIKNEILIGEWWAINTGTPNSSTGECISFVEKHFSKSNIWSEFNSVTNEIMNCIQKKDEEKIYHLIKINQSLLQSIGVVPKSVSQFIHAIEDKGGSAKIAGAGSVQGENAGLVLVGGYNPEELSSLYGYTCYKIKEEKNGTKII